MLNLNETLLLFSGALSLVLAISILWRKPKEKINWVFFSLVIFGMLWTIAIYFSNIINANTIYWTLFSFVAAMGIVVMLTYFTLLFPTREKPIPFWVHPLIILPAIWISYLTFFTKNIVVNYTVLEHTTGVEFGPYALLWTALFCSYLLASIIRTVVKFIKSDLASKQQIGIMFWGTLVTFAFATATNLVIPQITGNDYLSQYGPYAATFFVFFAAYALVKHEFTESRIITTKTFANALNVALLFNAVMANDLVARVIGWSVLVISVLINYKLIKVMTTEILQKEKLEKMTTDLTVANKHLMELDQAKDNFLAMTSHELNTPIAKVGGFLSMVLDDQVKGDISLQKRGYVATAYQESQRLAGIIRELLNVAKVETNRAKLSYSLEQINDIIKEVSDKLGPAIAEAGHKVYFAPQESPIPTTWMDRQRITDVFSNLLSNAILYTPSGGMIEIGAINKQFEMEVYVKDSGKGISPELRELIFQKFPQKDVLNEEIKGAGLGLYLSKKYVELHGGKIWFESDGAGKGSTFHFTLPLITQKPA